MEKPATTAGPSNFQEDLLFVRVGLSLLIGVYGYALCLIVVATECSYDGRASTNYQIV